MVGLCVCVARECTLGARATHMFTRLVVSQDSWCLIDGSWLDIAGLEAGHAYCAFDGFGCHVLALTLHGSKLLPAMCGAI